MDEVNIKDVVLKSVKQILHPKGNIFHGIKKSDNAYCGFGEAYFTTINKGEVKGWNKHKKMTLNIFVPSGEVKFVIFDDRLESETKGNFFNVYISQDKYKRLTIPPGLWIAFKGIYENPNIILNIANLEHDPSEMEKLDLDDIDYNWDLI